MKASLAPFTSCLSGPPVVPTIVKPPLSWAIPPASSSPTVPNWRVHEADTASVWAGMRMARRAPATAARRAARAFGADTVIDLLVMRPLSSRVRARSGDRRPWRPRYDIRPVDRGRAGRAIGENGRRDGRHPGDPAAGPAAGGRDPAGA